MNSTPNNKRVLMFAPFGNYQVHHQLDAVLGLTLLLKNAEVLVIGCDGIYRSCDVLTWSGDKSEQECRHCAAVGKELFNTFKLPSTQLREWLTPDDLNTATTWVDSLDPQEYSRAVFEDYPIGNWVTSSVFSYFRIIHGSLHLPHVRALHRQYLINGVLTVRAVSRIMNAYQPTNMCVFNGRFAPYRIAFELGQRAKLPVIVHERGFADDTFMIFQDRTGISTVPIDEISDAWGDVPLRQSELERVKTYLLDREKGKDTNFPSFYDFSTEYASVRDLLNIPAGVRIFGAFTSSEYEVAFIEGYDSVTSQLDMIDKLIEIFSKRDDYLVIRHHPYMGGDKISPPDCTFMTRTYAQAMSAPPNVRFVMPSEKLSSYALIWNIEGAVSFHSMMGIELAGRSVPVAAFRQSTCAKGVTTWIEDQSPEGLHKLVDALFARSDKGSIEDLSRCYRYINSLVNRISVRFNAFGIRNTFEPDIRVKAVEELTDGSDRTLERICNNILLGTSVYDLPGPDANQDPTEERAFLQNEAEQALATKKAVASAIVENPIKSTPVAIVHISTDQARFPQAIDWVVRSRHKVLHHYTVPHVESAALLSTVQSLKEEYVLIAPEAVRFDQCSISAGLRALDDRKNMAGVRFGAWNRRADGILNEQIFSKRRPVSSFDEAKKLVPEIADGRMALTLALFRREWLAQFLAAHPDLQASSTASALMEAYFGSQFIREDVPLVIL